ncbi:MAG: hypothetical protein OXE47_04275 [Gammaproteobacteria bacterium]|nr:hypothetical protein [Gammaproteobacteria bacterium]
MHAQVGNISLGSDRNVVVGERITLAPAGTLIAQQGCSPTIGCAWGYRWRQTPTAPALGWIPEGHAHCAGVAPNTGGLSVTATIPDVPVGTQLHFSFRASYRLTSGVKLRRQLGHWQPFLTINLRRDNGNAADYGAGLELQTNLAHLRLSARKSAGPLNLSLNLNTNNSINTANLLNGELRF